MTWKDDAICDKLPMSQSARWDIFFPYFQTDDGVEEQRRKARTAIAICHTCPVEAECLTANRNETEGVYGGTVPLERSRRKPNWPEQLRRDFEAGIHYIDLMAIYGVSRSQVYKIAKGKSHAS